MANVGFATLTIIPSARGFRRRLESEVSDDIDRVGRDTGDDFGTSFRRSATPHVEETNRTIRRETRRTTDDSRGRFRQFTSAVGRSFTALGEEVGRFNLRFGRFALAAAAIGPAVIGALAGISGFLVAIGTAAVTAAGTIASAFAGIAIGATLFAQTARGEAALTRFKAQATAILTDTAAPLLESFHRALPQITGLLNDLRPVLRNVFGTLGAVVSTGVSRAVDAFRQLGPAIGTVTQAASAFFDGFSSTFGLIAQRLTPALQELAPMLQRIASRLGSQLGGALSRLLPQLVRLGERVLPLLPGVLRVITGLFGTLINLGNFFADIFEAVTVTVARLGVAFSQANLRIQQMLDALPGMNRQQQIAAARADVLASKQQLSATKTALFNEESGVLAGTLSTQASRTDRARRALQNYQETILDGLEGQIAYRRQLDRTGEELQQGAVSFNLNTQEGRENASAVVDLINESRNQIETYREQGRTTDFIAGKTRQFTRELFQEARQAGFTDEQIRDLIVSSDNIPNSVRQRIKSNAGSVDGVVQGLIGSLDSLDGRVVSATVDIATTGVPAAGALSSLGDVRFRQHGGPVDRLRPFIVGEQGPELFVPERDGRIVSNANLESAAGGARQTSAAVDAGGGMQVAGGRVEITRDSSGRLEGWVRDLVVQEIGDDAEFRSRVGA